MNGDGRADVIVGAPAADDNGRDGSGSAYVVYGFGTPALSYPGPVDATVGQSIPPLVPSLARTGLAALSVSPPLPAGLTLDPSTGVISGLPTAPRAATTHTVTMTDLAGSAQAPVAVTVRARYHAACRLGVLDSGSERHGAPWRASAWMPDRRRSANEITACRSSPQSRSGSSAPSLAAAAAASA